MVFDSLKLLHSCIDRNLNLDEMLILQAVYDYQIECKNLSKDKMKALDKAYLTYFEKFSNVYDEGGIYERKVNLTNVVNKLLRDGWLEDYRKDKKVFKIGELLVSDKFLESFKGKESDEELFEQFKAAYPYFYRSQYNSTLENFNYQDSQELFKKFQKLVLSGNRKAKWAEFIMITRGVFEDDRDTPSRQRIDRYLETFYDNIELYRRIAETYYATH